MRRLSALIQVTARIGNAALAVVLLLALGSVARAAEPAKAEDLIRRGVEFRRNGKDNQALPLFQQAYELMPTPRTAAQLGLVDMALGYQLEAERYLSESLASRHDAWVTKNRGVLEQALAKVKLAIGEIAIHGPAGAEVIVNGHSAGQLPLVAPVRVGEGPVEVELHGVGFATVRRSVTVVGGGRSDVTFDVLPEPANVKGAAVKPLPAEPTARTTPPSAGPPEDRGSANLYRTAAWIAAGTGVALAAFGTYEAVTWAGRKSDFEQHQGPRPDNPTMKFPDCGTNDPNHGGPGCDDLYRKMQSARTAALIGFSAAGVVAVGSIVLFVTAPESPKDAEKVSVACRVQPISPFAVNCQLAF